MKIGKIQKQHLEQKVILHLYSFENTFYTG